MCIEILHLRKDLAGYITLPENCFYIGSGVLNLPKSSLYTDLSSNDYKQWLWNEIKAKATVYRELSKIKSSIILGNNIILACSCNNPESCNGQIIKKAIGYFLEQEKLLTKEVRPTLWEDYLIAFPIAENKLHEFCYWLISNSYSQEYLNFYELWLSFICQRELA